MKTKWWKSWSDPNKPKPNVKAWIPAGPFLLMLGDAGTGKSLIGRALAEELTKLYRKHGIQLYDVVCWENKTIPSEPKISVHPSPKGKELVIKLKRKEARKGLWKKILVKAAQAFMGILGATFLTIGLYWLLAPWIQNIAVFGIPIQEFYHHNFFEYFVEQFPNVGYMFMIGGSLTFSSIFVGWLGRFFGYGKGMKGVGGAEATKAPKLIVDNSSGKAPFVDATGHGSSQLFGSIAWDPYQTGDLGTPEHQRVTAGDVHRAHLGILYIDEIKNLKPDEAVTLLTVLEDGQLPIALRSRWHGGDTAAMAVATEPVPALVFLVGAGNMDSLAQIHPALMDRIRGYGKVVYMNNDMPNTVENRRKYVQFIAQEVKRFRLIPFSREACEEVVREARRRSGWRNRLTCKFRPMISIIKTAAILAIKEGKKLVERKHVIEAIEEHCKAIEEQVLEKHAERDDIYSIIDPKAEPKIGEIAGLAVITKGEFEIGVPLLIKASMVKCKKNGYFKVTGINRDENSWIVHSMEKVRHVILKLYGEDIAEHYKTHIDFAQEHNVDGPSAGVAMTLALASIILNKKIRQDVAVTGEINIDGVVTPVGGVHWKILAAQRRGFKKVLIPKKNYEQNIDPKDYKIKVVPCETLEDYMREIFVD